MQFDFFYAFDDITNLNIWFFDFFLIREKYYDLFFFFFLIKPRLIFSILILFEVYDKHTLVEELKNV